MPAGTPWAAMSALAVVLTFSIASCKTTPAEPVDAAEAVDVWEGSPWGALFLVAEAWGGRIEFTFAKEGGRELIIRAIGPRPETELGTMASGPDPICSVSDDPGLGDARQFRDCMNKARDEDVCDSDGVYVMEWDEDDGRWHMHCPEEEH